MKHTPALTVKAPITVPETTKFTVPAVVPRYPYKIPGAFLIVPVLVDAVKVSGMFRYQVSCALELTVLPL